MITSTMCLILNGCSVFPSLKASLLDNKPNYLLVGCVIQKRIGTASVLSNDGESIFFPVQKTIGTGQLQSFTNVYNAM